MPIPFRHDLERALAEFVDARRGLRAGRAFGVPAAFAGKRMFACVIEEGLACRLPPEALRRELRAGAKLFTPMLAPVSKKRRGKSSWVLYTPPHDVFPRQIARALEEGARFAATLSVEYGRSRPPSPASSVRKGGFRGSQGQ